MALPLIAQSDQPSKPAPPPVTQGDAVSREKQLLQDNKQVHSQNHLNSVWIYRDGRWQMLLHSRGGNTSK